MYSMTSVDGKLYLYQTRQLLIKSETNFLLVENTYLLFVLKYTNHVTKHIREL